MSRMTYIVRVITSWEFYIIWMYIVLYYEFLTNVHICEEICHIVADLAI